MISSATAVNSFFFLVIVIAERNCHIILLERRKDYVCTMTEVCVQTPKTKVATIRLRLQALLFH
jgi:hypothetical protein